VASEHITSMGFVVAAVVALPVGLAVGMTAPLQASTAGLVLYLGVVPTALAYSLDERLATWQWVGVVAASVVVLSLGGSARLPSGDGTPLAHDGSGDPRATG